MSISATVRLCYTPFSLLCAHYVHVRTVFQEGEFAHVDWAEPGAEEKEFTRAAVVTRLQPCHAQVCRTDNVVMLDCKHMNKNSDPFLAYQISHFS